MNFTKYFSIIMQDRQFTKHLHTVTSKLLLLILVLRFEDHFRYLILILNKYLYKYRMKIFYLNTVKKEKAVKSQSKVSKSDSSTLSLVVSWLRLQSFDTFFLTKFYLHLYFCFNISLNLLLVIFQRGFCLIA